MLAVGQATVIDVADIRKLMRRLITAFQRKLEGFRASIQVQSGNAEVRTAVSCGRAAIHGA